MRSATHPSALLRAHEPQVELAARPTETIRDDRGAGPRHDEGAPRPSMKAILQPAYGLPEVLLLAEVDRPVVHDEGVLVRVVAAGVNKGD